MKRLQTGSVGIETVGNRLRLRLPRQATSTNRYISTGLVNTASNHRKAQIVALAIEEDIATNRLQPYQTYIDSIQPEAASKPTIPKLATLSQLWDKYCDYKKPQLAATTYQTDYRKLWVNHIAKLPGGNAEFGQNSTLRLKAASCMACKKPS